MPKTESTPRVALKKITPDVSGAMGALHGAAVLAAQDAKVEPEILELIRIRASQINGCAFCIDMHTKDARAQGESEQRVYALNAWRETPFFNERERAALALAEAVTLVHDGHVPDEVYAEAAEVFDEAQLAALIWAATVINAYNRIAIATRMIPGAYQPTQKKARVIPGSDPGNSLDPDMCNRAGPNTFGPARTFPPFPLFIGSGSLSDQAGGRGSIRPSSHSRHSLAKRS